MLGGYIVLYPRARVLTLVIIILFFTVIELPALVMLGIWFAEQAVFAAAGLTTATGSGGGVAYFAHIGGFVFGALTIKLLATRRRQIPTRSPGLLTPCACSSSRSPLLFIAALGALTVRDIHTHGLTPVGVLAVIIVVVFTIGIIGALLHPPRR